MIPEEWNDRFVEIRSPFHQVVAQVLTMIVVSPVEEYPSHPEELPEFLQAGQAFLALRHGEPMSHLITGSVALPRRPSGLPNEAD